MNRPRRYRVPAREVEAICVATGEANLAAIKALCPEATVNFYGKIEVPTQFMDERSLAGIGDWITKFEDGSYGIWQRDEFLAMFEEVEPT